MDTRTQILDSAELLTKQRGFDAFSYRDISRAVGVKTSSIHYYFPSKEDLGVAMVERYVESLRAALGRLSAESRSGFDRVKGLFGLLAHVAGKEKHFCLCGMLAANVHSVSPRARTALRDFFVELEGWIEDALREGVGDGSVHPLVKPRAAAAEAVAIAEGAMLIGRVHPSERYFDDILEFVLARLRA